MFKKILIANRGEIAVRVIRACKEWGIATVAVHSDVDRDSMHVRLADESVCIGSHQPANSYLNVPALMSAIELTKAEAVHPGYGFLSENAQFSRICQEHKMKFIGARPEQIDGMGDKASAKETMKKAKVPTIPGSEGLLKDFPEAKKIAGQIKYPVILKATAGGGGRGMRLCWDDKELEDGWHSARQESAAAFGNDGMYLEKYIEEPRHIEIQIAADQHGNICHLSERDCSIQRRHQKLVEETPSPFMTDALRKKMGEAAKKAALAVNYEGVGTVEFLVDKHRKFFFMEMNTRIQVEHTITEEVINRDLIKEQIKIAAGDKISGKDYFPARHSIQCRINAEDPFKGFMPSPGTITNYHAPGGHGIRIDTHVYTNYVIPPHYDSMISKLITVAETREEAITKMKRALDEYIIEGVKTTIPFHIQLMKDKQFNKGNFTTKFMETFEIKKP